MEESKITEGNNMARTKKGNRTSESSYWMVVAALLISFMVIFGFLIYLSITGMPYMVLVWITIIFTTIYWVFASKYII